MTWIRTIKGSNFFVLILEFSRNMSKKVDKKCSKK